MEGKGKERKNQARHYSIGHAVAIVSISFLFNGCGSSPVEKQEPVEATVTEPAPDIQIPDYSPDTLSITDSLTVKQEETPVAEQSKPQTPPQPVRETIISRYYEEGYDKGYDDGEDDAVMNNGWEGQFDDECPYTGQKKKEYQLGYEMILNSGKSILKSTATMSPLRFHAHPKTGGCRISPWSGPRMMSSSIKNT